MFVEFFKKLFGIKTIDTTEETTPKTRKPRTTKVVDVEICTKEEPIVIEETKPVVRKTRVKRIKKTEK